MANDIPVGLRVPAQVPLDDKTYKINEAALQDLGVDNTLAYTYHKGLRVLCIEERTIYEWKEMEAGDVGLLPSDFVYPDGVVEYGVDYSNKAYNFVNTAVLAPLEKIDEGNGEGIIIRGRNPTNYGNIGFKAFDVSFSNDVSSVFGATGLNSFASGEATQASGRWSFTSGADTIASNDFSSAFGYQSRATGFASHAEGNDTIASGQYAHSEGGNTTAEGDYSHAQGLNTNAIGEGSHAEGSGTYVEGFCAHGEGEGGIGEGNFSHVGGKENYARSYGETSIGHFGTNALGSATTIVATDRLFNIGNGLSLGSPSNAFTIIKNGLATLPSVTNALITAEPTGKAVVTKEYLTNVALVPVSASVSGIVNNTALQELGGADKLINGVRIGIGNEPDNSNTVVGFEALSANTGFANTALGYQTLKNTTIGGQNVALGWSALANNVQGWANIGIGTAALINNTTGSYNIAVGLESMQSNISGDYNTAVGEASLENNTTGDSNAAFGQGALGRNTTGSYNTAVGDRALSDFGTGQFNTAVGADALSGTFNASGNYNSVVGYTACINISTGSRNSVLGYDALKSNTTGSDNIAIGANAGSLILSGGFNDICNNSIFIGSETRPTNNNETNQIIIGHSVIGSGSNTVTIGNNSITTTRLRGAVQGGSFVKDGGLSTQYLMADGSVSTASGSGIQSVIITGGWTINQGNVVDTTIGTGKTILSITSTLICTVSNNGYAVGDIVSISPTQSNDSGGLADSGVSVRYRADTSDRFTFNVNDRIDIPNCYNGGVGTGGAISDPVGATPGQWNMRHVILYI